MVANLFLTSFIDVTSVTGGRLFVISNSGVHLLSRLVVAYLFLASVSDVASVTGDRIFVAYLL